MAKRLEHAKHNEELSIKLYEEKKFLDWANTTAFYSALQFIQYKLLPGKYNGKSCNCIDDVAKALNCEGKHEAANQLVKIGLPVIATEYSFLMNSSFTARYHDYQIHPEQAKVCQKYLKEIKSKCDSKEEK